MDSFIDQLLARAKEAGIDPAEVCTTESGHFMAGAMEGNIDSYEVSATRSLGLRGMVDGRMGYASTEAFDEDAVTLLIQGVKERAALAEAKEQDEIFAGDPVYPELTAPESDVEGVSAEEKLALCLQLEREALAADPRIVKSEGAQVMTGTGSLRLVNSFGLHLYTELPLGGSVACGVGLVAKDGEHTTTGGEYKTTHCFRELDGSAIARAAVEDTLSMLHAAPVETGVYRAVIRWDAMRSLLSTFSGIFSAENAQQKLSLLAGREGEAIAAPCVTLMDDPLLPGGFGTAAFDGEGSASRTKAVIQDGVLKTLLHSRKTARKQGVETTGNASRSGVGGPIHVSPTNLFIQPGRKDLAALLEQMDDGLLITELGGLHAGANPVSGDFSLIAKGFLIVNGRKERPVEQITIAGNFYQLLREIREVGSDLEFRGGRIGCPSVDVGTLSVSGAAH